MKPETEYAARTLADLILRDDGQPSGARPSMGGAVVTVDMRAMSHSIRREIVLDHAAIGHMIADEIESQSKAVNLAAIIKQHVERGIAEALNGIERKIAKAVDYYVEEFAADIVRKAHATARMRVHDAIAAAVKDVA